eukprot:UN31058
MGPENEVDDVADYFEDGNALELDCCGSFPFQDDKTTTTKTPEVEEEEKFSVTLTKPINSENDAQEDKDELEALYRVNVGEVPDTQCFYYFSRSYSFSTPNMGAVATETWANQQFTTKLEEILGINVIATYNDPSYTYKVEDDDYDIINAKHLTSLSNESTNLTELKTSFQAWSITSSSIDQNMSVSCTLNWNKSEVRKADIDNTEPEAQVLGWNVGSVKDPEDDTTCNSTDSQKINACRDNCAPENCQAVSACPVEFVVDCVPKVT